jgi:hypothetical protein
MIKPLPIWISEETLEKRIHAILMNEKAFFTLESAGRFMLWCKLHPSKMQNLTVNEILKAFSEYEKK